MPVVARAEDAMTTLATTHSAAHPSYIRFAPNRIAKLTNPPHSSKERLDRQQLTRWKYVSSGYLGQIDWFVLYAKLFDID